MTSPGERGYVVMDDHAPRPASGVLTFMFTDIEGSTRRWEADADAMRVALDAHNKVLRDAVTSHGGTIFNYTGDGVCAVFTTPKVKRRPGTSRSAASAQVICRKTPLLGPPL